MDAKTRNQIEIFGEDLERYVDAGVSLTRREIYVGNISQGCAVRFHKNMMLLESISKDPINIHFNSVGGSDEAGWAIYDIIRSSKCYIRGYCWGICASMATITILACDERYVSPNTSFMIHEGSTVHTTGGAEHVQDSISYGIECKKRLDMMYEVYEEHTRLKKRDLQNLFAKNKGGDVYLTVKETVDYGFFDGVLSLNTWPKKKAPAKRKRKPAPKKRAKATRKRSIKKR